MTILGYIGAKDDVHYYYIINNDRIATYSDECSAPIMKRKLTKMRASAIVSLYEDFISVESTIIDRGKDVHVYSEKRKKVKSFIEWANLNADMIPESIKDNSIRMIDYIDTMINMISKHHSMRKDLMFIMNAIKETTNTNFDQLD
jgi:hypothetical protein